MKIAFKKRSTGIFDMLIRLWTRSPYVHCEMLFEDNIFFSAVPSEGTRFAPAGVLDPNTWDIFSIPTTVVDDHYLRMWCMAEVGCAYDWNGIFLSQILSLRREHPDKWFCSEICAAAWKKIGRLVNGEPCTFSPGKLAKRLKEAGATPCSQFDS